MWTLRNRLILVNAVVFLLTLVVLAGVLSSDLLNHLYGQLDYELASVGDQALEHVDVDEGRLRWREREEHPPVASGFDGFVRLLDERGNVTDSVGLYQELPVTTRALATSAGGGSFSERTPDGRLLRVYTRPIFAGEVHDGEQRAGFVQVARVPEEAQEITEQIRRSLFVAVPLALIVVGLAGSLAIRKALDPLTVMTENAASISADSISERRLLIPQTKDEVQALALAFNATLDRLAAAFMRQRRFTADASHELRTPVTAILGQAELALSRPRTPEAYQESLSRIKNEAERMQRLIGRMLALARAESGRQGQSFAPTDVAALLRTLTETLAPEAEAKGIAVHLHIPPSAIIVTDADSLTQILLNLIENSIAYTDRGEIGVTLERRADTYRIEVADSGRGIDPEHLPLIFEPFFRADPARQRQNGSIGLGLALAHELAHLLGGQIEAANRVQGGAVFTVTLPLQPAASSSGRTDSG